MNFNLHNLKKAGLYLAIGAAFTACKKDDDEQKVSIRAKVDYSKVTDTTTYSKTNGLFVDASGKTTVDLTEGNVRYKMFQGINSYNGRALGASEILDSVKLKNLFSNTNSPFTSNYHTDYATLNASGLQLRNVVASSWSAANAEVVRKKIEAEFKTMAEISTSSGVVGGQGMAGYLTYLNPTTGSLSKYLVNAKGIETAQIIQKSLIGAYQVDFIGNVLLNAGLEADNYSLVSGKNYTALEHVWDLAYSSLTLNPNFLRNSTETTRGTTEGFLGGYMWEYGKISYNAEFNYTKILPAFLKGRVAIINNDKAELAKQALVIRTSMEKAIANAAWNYLKKSSEAPYSDGYRAHAFGEGLGFIYSLRFANIHGANAAFSDELINELTGSANGFWDLTPLKTASVQAKIKAKFGI